MCQFSEYVRVQSSSQTCLGFQFNLWFIKHNFERTDRQGKEHYYLVIKQFK